MQTSPTITKLAPALLAAQRTITYAVKNNYNPHFKNDFADLRAVIDAIKPALNANNIFYTQLPAPSDNGTLALCTRLMHESGEWIESVATAPLAKNDPQGYASAISYIRRYALAAAVGIYQDDDDGNAASEVPVSATDTAELNRVIEQIKGCQNDAELQPVYFAAFEKYRGDSAAVARIVAEKDARKSEFAKAKKAATAKA